MKTLRLWVPALYASTLLFIQPLLAFDNAPEETEPALSLVFPFEQRGDDVVTTESVLINPGCIVPAGSVFLTIFVPPRADDADVRRKEKTEKTSTENAYSRSVSLPDKKDTLSPAQKAAFERATRTPWKSQMVYRAAMKQYRFDEMRLVFVAPGASNSSLEAFNLPEGMLLEGDKNQVRILAMKKDSIGVRLGLVPGAILLKVNGKNLEGLSQFQNLYFAEKKASHEAGKPVELTVQMPGQGGIKTVDIAPLKKLDLNDFFNATDVSAEPPKKPATDATPNSDSNTNASPSPNPVTPLAP